jgi:hypothetical protein
MEALFHSLGWPVLIASAFFETVEIVKALDVGYAEFAE